MVFAAYFAAFRAAEALCLLGCLRALWLDMPNDITCGSARPGSSPCWSLHGRHLLRDAMPCYIWGQLCCKTLGDEWDVEDVAPTLVVGGARRTATSRPSLAVELRGFKRPMSRGSFYGHAIHGYPLTVATQAASSPTVPSSFDATVPPKVQTAEGL